MNIYQKLLVNNTFGKLMKDYNLSDTSKEAINSYVIDVIEETKQGNDVAFERLIEMKDVKNLINKVVYRVHKTIIFDDVPLSKSEIETIALYEFFYRVKEYDINYVNTEMYMFIGFVKVFFEVRTKERVIENMHKQSEKEQTKFYYDIDGITINKNDFTFENYADIRVTLKQNLTEDEWTLMYLIYYQNMIQCEIAEALNLNRNTIRVRKNKLNEKIKNILK